MQKIYLTLILGLLFSVSKAQITSPDTVCKGNPFTASTLAPADNYLWAIDDLDVSPGSMSGTPGVNLKSYGLPQGICMKEEGGSFIAFVTTYRGGLLRINYGTNPLGSPTGITNIGTLSGVLDSVRGLDIVKDNGNWYGFAAKNGKLIRLFFGPSLLNTPTATVLNLQFYLSNPYQFTMTRFNGEWIGFAANRTNTFMSRFDFGPSITSIPTAAFFGGNMNLNSPVSFSLYNDNGSWSMLVTSMRSQSTNFGRGFFTNINFGTNLKNNTPTINLIANGFNPGSPTGSIFFRPTTVTVIKSCDTLYALITDTLNHITQVGFEGGSSFLAAATSADLGDFGLSAAVCLTSSFWYKDKLCIIGTAYDSTLVVYDNVFTKPASATLSTTNNGYTTSYNTGGIHSLSLITNEGMQSGPSAYCKDVYSIDNISISIRQIDTMLVAKGTKCDVYVWQHDGVVIPGAVTDTLTGLVDSGIYTVIGSKAGCNTFSTVRYYAHGFPANVNSLNNGALVNIYPNPSTGIFNIKATNIEAKHLVINCYNIMGALLSSNSVDADNGNVSTSIDLSGLPKGVYQLRMQSDKGSYMQRVVVE